MRPLLLLLSLAALAAAEDLQFDHTIIDIPEKVDSTVVADVDGDGTLDIVVQVGRRIDVYLLQKNATFAPPVSVELPKKAFLYDVFPVTAEKACDLVCMSADGVFCLAWKDGAFQKEEHPLVQVPTLFEGESTEGPLRYPFESEVDGDARQDLVIPQANRLLIYVQESGGRFRFVQRIPVDMQVRVETGGGSIQNQVSSSIRVPPCYVADFNGDGLPDLGVVVGEELDVYLQQPDHSFPASPSYHASVGIDRKKPKRRLMSWDIPPRIEDLDGDGTADVVATKVGQGTTHVFFGRKDRLDFSDPEQVQQIKVDGWTFAHWTVDASGRGRKDLVLAKVDKLGLSEGLQVLLTGKIDATILVFLQGEDGRFPKSASWEKTISVPFVVGLQGSSASVESPVIVDPRGDFDHDGTADLLVKSEKDELSLYLSGPGGIFDEKREVKVKTIDTSKFSFNVFENYEPLYLVDMNGDGKTDIVLHHKTFDGTHHVLEVFLSK